MTTEQEWQPVVELVERELARIDGTTAQTVRHIRDELPDFLLVPLDEHTATVREQLRLRLMAFRGRRPWNPEDLAQARQLARRRARQGVSVDSLISAFHVGDRELWRTLSQDPGTASPLLPELTSLMLESMQSVSTTLAAAHSSETREQDRLQVSMSQRFVELLQSGDQATELRRLASYLDIPPAATFIAVVTRTPDGADISGHVTRGVHVVHGRIADARVALVVDAAIPEHLIKQTHGGQAMTGVSAARVGLEGAGIALRQALIAVELSTSEAPVARFTEQWELVGLTGIVELIEPDVQGVVDIAMRDDALRSTIKAFAASDLSKQRCAEVCHVHPNTVAYRLDRWMKLTGWNPRTFTGLQRSVIACRLAEIPRAD